MSIRVTALMLVLVGCMASSYAGDGRVTPEQQYIDSFHQTHKSFVRCAFCSKPVSRASEATMQLDCLYHTRCWDKLSRYANSTKGDQ